MTVTEMIEKHARQADIEGVPPIVVRDVLEEFAIELLRSIEPTRKQAVWVMKY